ncbi:hypothetical protein [Qingshengfaniella alkalisoli]|uniref:Uncharacterized protein n=1 Tax=Qingshengfaniella alkalisoli TaxID=2599296 RepID=A0A5B8I9F5_9RHOB|nr:hypothetical protein [Qingshengfaniella alkalisoli]QDY69576.1 hypothetical protein FPZ52_08035 [Qingshengfaniella alkalisoli]
MSNHWYISHSREEVTLARVLPVRFDLSAEITMPVLRKTVLAHEVRKDVWRSLQGLRGFSPVVTVREELRGLRIIAGGRIENAKSVPPSLQSRLEAVLNDPHRQARWRQHARIRP